MLSHSKFVSLYSTVKMMHGPINTRFTTSFVSCFSVKSFHVLDVYFVFGYDEAVCVPEFRTLEPV